MGGLEELVRNFSLKNLEIFLQNKNFVVDIKDYGDTEDIKKEYEGVQDVKEVGYIYLKDKEDELIVFAIKIDNLTERTSKKKQFNIAKKLLEKYQRFYGLFIFYDEEKDEGKKFRFSFVFKTTYGTKAEYSHYKRFTFFVSPDRPNKTFINQLKDCDFSNFGSIKEAFSVEPVTKEFYKKLQNWYYWAMDRVKFPEDYKYSQDPEKDKEIRNAQNLIRLLTRLIFIWFLKEKDLVLGKLFDEDELKNIVKDFGKGNNYYNAILQNLFFATLNRPIEERGWAKNEGFPENRKNFGIKSLYRYEDKFLIPPEKVLELFRDIPFINGGLFDCLDRDNVYIDGFSRREEKQAKISDELFFSEEKTVDLSKYGLSDKAEVSGLINILKSYNFTTDEATPIDQEIALDPELLGKVFENLLASYDEETATTARKATGSYYTPREIVDYMVEESLREYLKTKVPEVENELDDLFSYSNEEPNISDDDLRKKLIYAIDQVKIIDPACGSGAFPMGILHKLVFLLQKLDPKNEIWKEIQLERASKEADTVFRAEKDKQEREKLLEEINENFDESINYPDYARKLYLIENCIYGVDIQPIAIQISKLRFFISLILDQKVDKDKPNFGILTLPNLETKFVAANTLIGLDKPIQKSLRNPDIERLEQELKFLRHRYFRIKSRAEKIQLQNKDRELREKLKNALIGDGWNNEVAEKIVKFDIFDQNASADWFDPEWMFGISDGFDIVIGNPPYVRQEKIKAIKPILQKQNYEVFTSTADLYVYFYEKGYQVLREEGILAYITSNKWMRAKYGEKLRKFLKEKTAILKIVDFSGYRVFEQTVDTNILIFRKQKPFNEYVFEFLEVKSNVKDMEKYLTGGDWQTMYQSKLSDNAWTLGDENVLSLKEKIEKVGKPLKDWDVKIYRGVLTGYNDAFIIDTETRNKILANCKDEEERKRTEEIIKPVLRGRDIRKYYYKWAGLWVIYAYQGIDIQKYPTLLTYLSQFQKQLKERTGGARWDKTKTKILSIPYKWYELQVDYHFIKQEFEKEKIVWQEIVREPSFAYDNSGMYVEATAFLMTGKNLKYIIGLLNSKPVAFFFKTFYAGGGLGEDGYRYKKAFLEQLPLPPITKENQPIVDQIIQKVEEILALTQSPDYDTNTEKQKKVNQIQKEIDQLVYQIYNLTEEEIKIIS
jgi:adenine-specific DNA-methyltransferase